MVRALCFHDQVMWMAEGWLGLSTVIVWSPFM